MEINGNAVLEAEACLAQKAKAGNDEALARLLHSVYPRVFGYVMRLSQNRELASDIVQGAMEQAIRRFERYDCEKSAFATWISRIAVNLLIDHYRKIRRENAFAERYFADPPVNSDFNSAPETGFSSQDINAALARLPLAMRLPVVMQYVMGYTQKDIARVLKIPVGTVKSRVHNALKFLKKVLGNDETY